MSDSVDGLHLRPQALIGRQTKDQVLGLFLQDRVVYSIDGKQWSQLAGLLTVNWDLLEDSQPFVPTIEVSCVYRHKTTIGTTVEKTLFHKVQELGGPGDSTFSRNGRCRYPFFLPFGSEPLPPSLSVSHGGGDAHGCQWKVTGYLKLIDSSAATRLPSRRSPMAMHFLMEYRFSPETDRNPADVSGAFRTSIPFLRTPKLVTILHGNLESSVIPPAGILDIHLNLENVQPGQQLHSIVIVAQQKVEVRLPDGISAKFKAVIAKLQDNPAPRYDHSQTCNVAFDYKLPLGHGISSGQTDQALQTINCVRKPLLDDDISDSTMGVHYLVHSTPPALDSKNVTISYNLKVVAKLSDANITRTRVSRIAKVRIPFVVTTAQSRSTHALTDLDQVSNLTSPNGRDAVQSLLSSILEDLEQSITDIKTLSQSWRRLRSDSQNCTHSSDHARELLPIVEQLMSRLTFFGEIFSLPDASITLPTNPMPFNVLVLEMELLARATPDDFATTSTGGAGSVFTSDYDSLSKNSVVDKLMQNILDFFLLGKEVTKAWAASRGRSNGGDEQRLFNCKMAELERSATSLTVLLEAVSEGGDSEIVFAEDLKNLTDSPLDHNSS
ncbi:hypothetical protein DFS34DRAFT_625268 [Phlyctochytrium arcticum]|nr:hypothetical protein DFS34DRAFT_625268 [Phlyctochytrium arcticum]